ncbi:MAG: PepSY-associated TM helix domain-containing protein [Gemmatimonadetes bacterium]|nr:PepSY-associated TM helix domain-containing protein [Gemmatimonadota bacterium]
MKITTENRPFLIRMDDLHRGKDSGTAWSWLIDLSAILLLLGALTGITLWIALPKRRTLGLIALGLGVGVCVAVYLLIVP